MVTYRYLKRKFLDPLDEKLRQESREEGRVEGQAEGQAEGAKRTQQKWEAWNRRRMEVEAKGETFDEPPPSLGTETE